ncbi:MAG: hypothetical protein LUC86_00775 [Prevotellaceae bacterium]|nr:hypothetical protein [Prevotellaceae bacterium]
MHNASRLKSESAIFARDSYKLNRGGFKGGFRTPGVSRTEIIASLNVLQNVGSTVFNCCLGSARKEEEHCCHSGTDR